MKRWKIEKIDMIFMGITLISGMLLILLKFDVFKGVLDIAYSILTIIFCFYYYYRMIKQKLSLRMYLIGAVIVLVLTTVFYVLLIQLGYLGNYDLLTLILSTLVMQIFLSVSSYYIYMSKRKNHNKFSS